MDLLPGDSVALGKPGLWVLSIEESILLQQSQGDFQLGALRRLEHGALLLYFYFDFLALQDAIDNAVETVVRELLYRRLLESIDLIDDAHPAVLDRPVSVAHDGLASLMRRSRPLLQQWLDLHVPMKVAVAPRPPCKICLLEL